MTGQVSGIEGPDAGQGEVPRAARLSHPAVAVRVVAPRVEP